MNGFGLPPLQGMSATDSTDLKTCPWCTALDTAGLSLHDSWCERVQAQKIIKKSSTEKERARLKHLAEALYDQLKEYETALRLIVSAQNEDGTICEDFKSTLMIAKRVLRKHKAL